MEEVRSAFLFRAAAVLLLGCSLQTPACSRSGDPAVVIRQAYEFYSSNLRAGVDPIVARRDELSRYLTDSFLASLARSQLAENADSLTGAVLRVGEMKVEGNRAHGRATLSSRLLGVRTFYLELRRRDRGWKIDDIKIVADGID